MQMIEVFAGPQLPPPLCRQEPRAVWCSRKCRPTISQVAAVWCPPSSHFLKLPHPPLSVWYNFGEGPVGRPVVCKPGHKINERLDEMLPASGYRAVRSRNILP